MRNALQISACILGAVDIVVQPHHTLPMEAVRISLYGATDVEVESEVTCYAVIRAGSSGEVRLLSVTVDSALNTADDGVPLDPGPGKGDRGGDEDLLRVAHAGPRALWARNHGSMLDVHCDRTRVVRDLRGEDSGVGDLVIDASFRDFVIGGVELRTRKYVA